MSQTTKSPVNHDERIDFAGFLPESAGIVRKKYENRMEQVFAQFLFLFGFGDAEHVNPELMAIFWTWEKYIIAICEVSVETGIPIHVAPVAGNRFVNIFFLRNSWSSEKPGENNFLKVSFGGKRMTLHPLLPGHLAWSGEAVPAYKNILTEYLRAVRMDVDEQ
ncbi:MAG: hypothetical protein HGA67_00120 [Candidatus Yonathbacteria bacterium]|nr:hypothetical protein [Candidatus Yonathbacteria bacterium]